MKSGPFITLFAETFGVDATSVRLFARNLRESGLLTTGARGVNAPDMTAKDAALMSIALLATTSPAQAVKETRYYASLVQDTMRDRTRFEMAGLTNFESALEGFFSGLWDFDPEWRVTVHQSFNNAAIGFGDELVRFIDPELTPSGSPDFNARGFNRKPGMMFRCEILAQDLIDIREEMGLGQLNKGSEPK